MSHPNSHSGQIVSIKNAANGAPNLRGETIVFLHLPLESLSTQKAESLDQTSVIAHKVRKPEHFHQHGEISRAAKVFTNDVKPTNDPGHVEHLRQLFPHPSADYDSP